MKHFGMTMKEWSAFGIGGSLNGALAGVLLHSTFLFVFNGLCLGLNIYYFNATGDDNESH